MLSRLNGEISGQENSCRFVGRIGDAPRVSLSDGQRFCCCDAESIFIAITLRLLRNLEGGSRLREQNHVRTEDMSPGARRDLRIYRQFVTSIE